MGAGLGAPRPPCPKPEAPGTPSPGLLPPPPRPAPGPQCPGAKSLVFSSGAVLVASLLCLKR